MTPVCHSMDYNILTSVILSTLTLLYVCSGQETTTVHLSTTTPSEITGSIRVICNLPLDPGPCDANLTRWYFNIDTQSCQVFQYGGCEGNDNNFPFEDICRFSCIRGLFVCPAVTCSSPCQTQYDEDGCPMCVCGNHNCNNMRCRTNEHCEMVPGRCDEPDEICYPTPECISGADVSETTAVHLSTTIHSEVSETTTVHRFTTPPFGTSTGPIRGLCLLPPDSGPCDANLMRWHFNVDTLSCQQFQYGGCEGNDNNFPSEDSCRFNCEPGLWICPQVTCSSSCQAQYDEDGCPMCVCSFFNCDNATGLGRPCRSNEHCEMVPGICDEPGQICYPTPECVSGSDVSNTTTVRLTTQITNLTEHSTTTTTSKPGITTPYRYDLCYLPPDPGPCENYSMRWYYNAENDSCQLFQYGGCDGNANKFYSEPYCGLECSPITWMCGQALNFSCESPCNKQLATGFCEICVCSNSSCEDIQCRDNEHCEMIPGICSGPDQNNCYPTPKCFPGPAPTTAPLITTSNVKVITATTDTTTSQDNILTTSGPITTTLSTITDVSRSSDETPTRTTQSNSNTGSITKIIIIIAVVVGVSGIAVVLVVLLCFNSSKSSVPGGSGYGSV